MLNILWIGLGGFLGSTSRYLLGEWINKNFWIKSLPLGTLFVNVLGCFLIGFAWGFLHNRFDHNFIRFFGIIGFLGGFTTYSTFGYEKFQLLAQNQIFAFFGYVFLQLTFGLCAVALGYYITRFL